MLTTTSFLGMEIQWWILFILLLIWLFIIPYDIPGQRNRRASPLDVLKKRYAAGKISTEEFKKASHLLQDDPGNKPHNKTQV